MSIHAFLEANPTPSSSYDDELARDPPTISANRHFFVYVGDESGLIPNPTIVEYHSDPALAHRAHVASAASAL